MHLSERGNRTDLVANKLDKFDAQVLLLLPVCRYPRLQDDETTRELPFQRIGDADDRSLGDRGMARQHLFH